LLELTLSFTLVYDENLVDVIPTLPFTLGTVAQNQLVDMVKVAPGELRFTFRSIKPAISTGRLIGFPVQALIADSSRRVAFHIKDIDLAGCPSTFSTDDDTTVVCQCFQPLKVAFPPISVIESQGILNLPVSISNGLIPSIGLTARIDVQLPSDAHVLDVLNGDLFPDGAFIWTDRGGGLISVELPSLTQPSDSTGTVCVIQIEAPVRAETSKYKASYSYTELWQRCCPELGDLPNTTILVNGVCERILSRRSFVLTNAPNPLTLATNFETTFSLHIPIEYDGSNASLTVVNLEGRPVATLLETVVPAGERSILFKGIDLPSGIYTAILILANKVWTRSLRIIR